MKIFSVLLFFALNTAIAQVDQVAQVIDSSGDLTHTLDGAGVGSDGAGNIYVTGTNTDNLFKISSSTTCSVSAGNCQVVEILDATGDGMRIHDRSSAVTTDSSGHVYVSGQFSDNVWRINAPNNCSTDGPLCDIFEIIDTSGDGIHLLDTPVAVAVDHDDNVYVAGAGSDNVFRIGSSTTCSTGGIPGCIITEIIDATGDGSHALDQPVGLAVDSEGSVYVTTQNSDNVFKISTPGDCNTTNNDCVVNQIIDESTLTDQAFGRGIAVDSDDNVYMTSLGFFQPASIYKIATPGNCSTDGVPCIITKIFEQDTPQQAGNMAVDDADNIYFVGGNGENAFRIDKPINCSTTTTPCIITEIIGADGDGNGAVLDGPGTIVVANDVDVYVGGGGSDNVFRISGAAESLDLIFRNGLE